MIAYNTSIVRDGLVLHLDAANVKSYPGSGTIWKDLSGNGNDGTLVNGVGYSTDNKGAMVFDGTNDYIDCGNPISLNFGANAFTISFTCFRTAAGFQGGSYVNKGLGTATGFGSRDGAFLLHSAIGQFARIDLVSTANAWRVETLVINQTSSPYIKRYTNGVLNQVGYLETPSNLGSIDNTNNFVIGLSGAGGINRYFTGIIPSCIVYNRALTAQEIQQNFESLRGRYGL